MTNFDFNSFKKNLLHAGFVAFVNREEADEKQLTTCMEIFKEIHSKAKTDNYITYADEDSQVYYINSNEDVGLNTLMIIKPVNDGVDLNDLRYYAHHVKSSYLGDKDVKYITSSAIFSDRNGVLLYDHAGDDFTDMTDYQNRTDRVQKGIYLGKYINEDGQVFETTDTVCCLRIFMELVVLNPVSNRLTNTLIDVFIDEDGDCHFVPLVPISESWYNSFINHINQDGFDITTLVADSPINENNSVIDMYTYQMAQRLSKDNNELAKRLGVDSNTNSNMLEKENVEEVVIKHQKDRHASIVLTYQDLIKNNVASLKRNSGDCFTVVSMIPHENPLMNKFKVYTHFEDCGCGAIHIEMGDIVFFADVVGYHQVEDGDSDMSAILPFIILNDEQMKDFNNAKSRMGCFELDISEEEVPVILTVHRTIRNNILLDITSATNESKENDTYMHTVFPIRLDDKTTLDNKHRLVCASNGFLIDLDFIRACEYTTILGG